MNQLFSIDLLDLKVVDVVSADKIYPPHFKTVQNRQPVPVGALKERDGLVAGDVNTTAKVWECQLITPFFLKGSPNTDTIAAYSNVSTAVHSGDNLCHLFKNVDGVWSQITTSSTAPASSIVDDGFYYVCNALSAKGNDINPVLVLVKAESTNAAFGSGGKNCCFAIYKGLGDKGTATGGSATTLDDTTKLWKASEWIGGTLEVVSGASSGNKSTISGNTTTRLTFGSITAIDNTSVYRITSANTTDYFVKSFGNQASTAAANIKTINWQSAMCVEYHLNKLWVGGLRESFNPDLVASAANPLVNRHNRIRWSKTGAWDDNYVGTGAGDAGSWAEAGTGYLDIPVTGEHRVVGLRQFRGQLYALTTSDLFIVTGTTSAQFGLTRICSSPSAVGQTMWASDNYLFWADANGIQMFNGSQVKNITEDTVPLAYKQKQIEQYNPLGTTIPTGYGKVPTAFINEKLKIYGIHWPDLSAGNYPSSPDLPGKETWLYNYKSQSFSTYVYRLGANYTDVNYVSDYHDTGFVWMGLTGTDAGTSVIDNPVAAKYTFEPSTDVPDDPGGAVTTILETGDLNLAAMNGFSYEDVIKLNRVDFYVVPDSTTNITYKLDITIDNIEQAQQTVTVDFVLDATQPQHYVVPLPTSRAGSFFRVKITEDTAGVKGDLRRADLFYEVMFKRGGARK